MASEWITTVASLAGAVVGAGATLSANWFAARTQSRTQVTLAVGKREEQSADVRRAACAEYLTAVDSFMDQARELVSRMENGAPPTECKGAHDAYSAGWELLQRVCAPVVIAGPSELAEMAEALKSQLGDLGDECDGWYAAHENGSVRGRGSKVSNAQRAAEEARAAFVSVAQKHAYAGSPSHAV